MVEDEKHPRGGKAGKGNGMGYVLSRWPKETYTAYIRAKTLKDEREYVCGCLGKEHSIASILVS